MLKYVFLCVFVLAAACNFNVEEDINYLGFEATPQLYEIIEQFDENINRYGQQEYNYVVCSSPWDNGRLCITASLPSRMPHSYLFSIDYKDEQKIFFITGLESILKRTSSNEGIDHFKAPIIYDPPVLCFELSHDGGFVLCELNKDCYHCTSPPPPHPDTPTIKFVPSN